MNKPSCYPSECHTCESPECMITLNCPVCKCEHSFNVHDDIYFLDCPCGSYIEITELGEVWATDEDGNEHEGGDAVTVAERTRRYHRDQQKDEISNGLMSLFRAGMEAAAKGSMVW